MTVHFVRRDGEILCGLKVAVGAFIDATRTDKLVTCEACHRALSSRSPPPARVERWKEAHKKLWEAMSLLSCDPHYDDNVIEDLSCIADSLKRRMQ